MALLTHAYKLDIPLVAMEKKQHCQDWPVEVVHLMYYMYMYVYLVGGKGPKRTGKSTDETNVIKTLNIKTLNTLRM